MLDDEKAMNQRNIDEFRANNGRLSGPFEGAPVLLLHHRGAKSNTEYVTPIMYQALDCGWAVFASAAGRAANPAWYHNLLAHPHTTIELGDETLPVTARVADHAEREPIWQTQKQRYPGFAGYEQKTDRVIPVVVLDPA